MTSLIFTKSAIARILHIKPAQIVEYRVWAFVVWVHVKGQRPTMLSKKAFYGDFVQYRKDGGKALEGRVIKHDRVSYTVQGTQPYSVKAMQAIVCTCEDYKKQTDLLGGGVCKHGYAVLGVMGLRSLAEYQAIRRQERLDRLALA